MLKTPLQGSRRVDYRKILKHPDLYKSLPT